MDIIHVEGIIRTRLLPEDWTYADYAYWWLPEFDSNMRIIRMPRMSNKEKERYTVAEEHNLLTTNGRTQILTFIGASGTGTGAFAQYFAVGTGSISSVSAGDTSLATELYRAVPASAVISGNQIDISIPFGAGVANGTWTNAGIFGVNATSTSGSGTLMTHALYSYTKTNTQSVTNDYLITQS